MQAGKLLVECDPVNGSPTAGNSTCFIQIPADFVTNIVGTNYGGKFISGGDITGATAGLTVTNTLFLTNLGNAIDIFDLFVTATNSNGVTGSA